MLFLIIAGLYALLTLGLTLGWYCTKSSETSQVILRNSELQPKIRISVIMVVRNEAENLPKLLQDLENQVYHKENWELIIVNDYSEDHSSTIIQEFQWRGIIQIKFLENEAFPEIISPKKRGITNAIQHASGDVIVCTDGDCRVSDRWLLEFASFFTRHQPAFVSGVVAFIPQKQLFSKIQSIEFASLVASGAATLRFGIATMCNGANLAFLKTAFYAVKGYAGTEHIASGDDEFLMHKITLKFPKKVLFMKSQAGMVLTNTHAHWQAFKQQRKRWASKWEHYQNNTIKILAFFIFLANCNVFLSLVAKICNFLSERDIFFIIFSKFVSELIFLFLVLKFLKKTTLIIFFPLIFVLYPFYIVFFGLVSRKKTYFWKGRKF